MLLLLILFNWNFWATYIIAHISVHPNILGPLNTHHAFPVSNCSPASFNGRDLQCEFLVTIKSSEKGVFISLPSDRAPKLLFSLPETYLDLNSSEGDAFLKTCPY